MGLKKQDPVRIRSIFPIPAILHLSAFDGLWICADCVLSVASGKKRFMSLPTIDQDFRFIVTSFKEGINDSVYMEIFFSDIRRV